MKNSYMKWKSRMEIVKKVTTNFLGKSLCRKCRYIVADLVKSYKAMGCNMSLKVHFVDYHLSLLPRKSLGSERWHGERFCQGISTKEKRYKANGVPVRWLIFTVHLK